MSHQSGSWAKPQSSNDCDGYVACQNASKRSKVNKLNSKT